MTEREIYLEVIKELQSIVDSCDCNCIACDCPPKLKELIAKLERQGTSNPRSLTMSRTETIKCGVCGHTIDNPHPDELYCYGCYEYVCKTCPDFPGIGKHEVTDHKEALE